MSESNPVWVLGVNGLLTRGYSLEKYELQEILPSGAIKVKKYGGTTIVRPRPCQYFFFDPAPLVEKIRETLATLLNESMQRVKVLESIQAKTNEELIQRATDHPAERPAYMDGPLEVD